MKRDARGPPRARAGAGRGGAARQHGRAHGRVQPPPLRRRSPRRRLPRRRAAAALLLLDIDHFKRVNDAYGHSGPATTCSWPWCPVRLLFRCWPPGAVLARWGGEEFMLLVPELRCAPGALDLAEAMRVAVGARPLPGGLDGDLAGVFRPAAGVVRGLEARTCCRGPDSWTPPSELADDGAAMPLSTIAASALWGEDLEVATVRERPASPRSWRLLPEARPARPAPREGGAGAARGVRAWLDLAVLVAEELELPAADRPAAAASAAGCTTSARSPCRSAS